VKNASLGRSFFEAYAGDDIRRFTPPPLEFLELPISSEKYLSELEAAWFSSPKENRYLSTSSPEYGFYFVFRGI